MLVAVDADHVGLGAPLQHRHGVAAETERGVDEDRPRALERRRHQGHDPVEQDRDVSGSGHRSRPSVPEPDDEGEEERHAAGGDRGEGHHGEGVAHVVADPAGGCDPRGGSWSPPTLR